MEILIKEYGASRIKPAAIIELTCKDYDTQFTVDVTNINGFVDDKLIQNLRDIANDLEDHNNKKRAL